ncbi:MAG: tetratricopeptide repeat protein [Anaerolineales bacterium]|nr:tetratricopeptide repeat protein [Anaerolineales bacterium]
MPLPLLHIHLFGNLRLVYGAKALPFNALPKTLPLFAYLLLNRGPIPRDALAFTFWPDVDESEARANLRRHLYDLRRVLPESAEEWVTREGQTLRWNTDAPYWLDVEAFERYCPEPARMDEALSLYTGDLLPEVYEDWLDFDRQRLRTLYFSTAGHLIATHRAAGHFETAITIAEQALRQDPWREDLLGDLILSRYLSGDRPGALQAYQAFKKRLGEELNIQPMPETTKLYETVMRGEPVAGYETVPPEMPLPARGRATPGDRRPLPPGAVPVPLKPILGREKEIAAILDLIGQQKAVTRLLTLTGTAGTGKTRLALEIATRLVQERAEVFPDGVFFIPLASLTRADLVLPTIATALGVKLSDSTGLVQALVNDLRYKQVLLVLDNLEHLMEAVAQLGELLNAAAGLRVMATSQAALRLYGEREYPVRPLGLPEVGKLPDVEALGAYPSVALFVETARAANPHFALNSDNGEDVARICAQLDGLPLAIELAAARTRILSPAGLLDQLATRLDILTNRSRDVPERHRTLRSAVEWSYNLMAEEEKKVFARLAIFPGGFSSDAVGEVLMTPETAHLALDLLELLAEKNIIQPDLAKAEDQPRFFMLATLQNYARERLLLDPELPALYRGRAGYYARLADQAENGLLGAEQSRWLAWIEVEENNLRETLDWAFRPEREEDEMELGMRLVSNALARYWKMRGRLDEGQSWFRRAREQSSRLSRNWQKKLAQHTAAFCVWQGDYDAARKYYEEEYALALMEGDDKARANFLQGLGLVAGHLSDYSLAEKYFVEAIALERVLSNGETSYNLTVALNNLGIVYRHLGNYVQAIQIQQEVLAYRREQADYLGQASALSNIATLEGLQAQYEIALQHFQESLKIRQELGDHLGVVICLGGMASMFYHREHFEQAVSLYSITRKLRQQFNYQSSIETRFEEMHDLDLSRRRLGEAAYATAWEVGARLSLESAMAYALSLT